jgi:hypothetical protein
MVYQCEQVLMITREDDSGVTLALVLVESMTWQNTCVGIRRPTGARDTSDGA